MYDQTKDPLIRILAGAATLTLLTGVIYKGILTGWIEGVSIYIATIFIIAIASANDWLKENQFVRLLDKIKDENVAVIRGKYGLTQSVNVYQLSVGDIILIETGMRVPCDCLLIEGVDVSVDEKAYDPVGERDVKSKEPATAENIRDNPDPFILSQSLVDSG